MTITTVAGVRDTDSGIASATLNVGQQMGGSIGLPAPATVAAAAARSATSSRIAALSGRLSADDLAASVIPRPFPDRQPDRIIALAAALHDTAALHTVAQTSAQATDAGFRTDGIFALAAVELARAAINVKRPEAQPPRD